MSANKTKQVDFGSFPLYDLAEETVKLWKLHDDCNIDNFEEEKIINEQEKLLSEASSGLTCNTCVLRFDDVLAQQTHFKTNLHLHNLKRKQKKLPPISDLDILTTLEDNSSSSEEEEDSEEATISQSDVFQSKQSKEEPVVVFSDGGQKFKVYSTVLQHRKRVKWNEVEVNLSEEIEKVVTSSFKWIVILLQSGFFAASVFEKDKVICHKRFQRYTTRRKQGGSQSSFGSANSAGATLRLYNERALRDEIRILIKGWNQHVASADLIFLGVAKTLRHTFFEGNPPLFNRDDDRIRKIPFGTLRPTFNETRRVHSQLVSARFSPFSQKAPMLPNKSIQLASKKVEKPSSKFESIEKEEQNTVSVAVQEDSEFHIACKENNVERVEGMLKVLDNIDINERNEKDLSTALHYAAANSSTLVTLLLDMGANPCLEDVRGRTPYFLCDDKDTRNMFRRFMAKYPDRWDYAKAKVPSGLTDDMEEQKKIKDREKKRKARERKKVQKAEEKKNKEIERLAKEAEAIRLLEASKCDFCRKPCDSSPFQRLTFKYCSTKCVNEHKKQLVREAAMRRFDNNCPQ